MLEWPLTGQHRYLPTLWLHDVVADCVADQIAPRSEMKLPIEAEPYRHRQHGSRRHVLA